MSGKKYVIDNKELMKEWDWDKNNEIDLNPNTLTLGSHQKIWWKCNNGHEWQAMVCSRNQGRGCPICANRHILEGYNDLGTIAPQLLVDWNYSNNDISPKEIGVNYYKNINWKCHICSHEWKATPANRNKGTGCPICSKKSIVKQFSTPIYADSLQAKNPALANEWNYDKNEGLTPNDVFPNSGKKVWWKCSKGHEWQAKIYHRNTVSGCPICKSERNTSLPEFALLYYFRKIGLDPVHSYKEYGFELDIYIPSKKIAIEYDGYFWHKNKLKKDLEKNLLCEKQGIVLYRIREGLSSTHDSSIDYIIEKDNKNDLEKVIVKIINNITNKHIDVNLERDAILIENLREFIEKNNSISILNPELAAEWNYEKNYNLKPEFFAANSGKKVWWKCSKGHEWQAVIMSRNKGRGCPYCSGRIAIKGENDLQTTNPLLAREWNHERNIGITPSDVLPNSEKKVWWKCNNGHEWQAMVYSRNQGRGCPYCSNKDVLKGYNDLQTINPSLANEWNYEKNEGLTPRDVVSNSNKRVWWKCNNGHEWQAMVCSRNQGRGCPYCSNKAVLKGYNDLQTINPSLANEWNYEKNEGLTPRDVVSNSNKRVWWKCSKGHEWQAYINTRNNQGNKCPYCSNQAVLKGYNDLQTINPSLANEWDYSKNDLSPETISPNSHQKVWWICSKGHSWEAQIRSRNNGSGCPYCYRLNKHKKDT